MAYFLSESIRLEPEDEHRPFRPKDKEDLMQALSMPRAFRTSEHGKMSTWDVSQVTDMSFLFWEFKFKDDDDISGWNVSNVTNMKSMFYGSTTFNQPLNSWDVSNVTNMSFMFYGCKLFNQPLNSWTVSNVTSMDFMFENCHKFNQPLNSWDVSNVTSVSRMFAGCKSFNQPLNSWNVSNVKYMSLMFYDCVQFNQPLNSWNVSNVTDMMRMFKSCGEFNQPLNSWNVSNVTNMYEMFYECEKFNQPLNSWNVSNVTYMSSMFEGCQAFYQSVNSWRPPAGAFTNHMFDNTPLQDKQRFWPGTQLTAAQEEMKATQLAKMEDFKQNPNKRPLEEVLNKLPVCPVCRELLDNKKGPYPSSDENKKYTPADNDVIYVCVKNHLMHRGCAKDCAIPRNTDGEYYTKLHYSGKCPVCKQPLIEDLDNQTKVPETKILEDHQKKGGRLRRTKCTRQTKRRKITLRRVRKHKRAACTRKRRY